MSVFSSLMNHDFFVFRRERTSDGQGGWSFVPTQIGEVQGRIRPATSQERVEARQEGREITHVFYAVAGTDVARGDTLVTDGLLVEVEGVREPSKAGHHLEVDCREKQPEVSLEAGS
ncbi:MAG: phage head closure protein [Anaerolineales bacterium]|nr:phage head closure protein [Anaerolineales bacterium]